jgi:hypothetical protein
VAITTDDCAIHGDDQQLLIVPRVDRSRNVVTFQIEPKRTGTAIVNALFIAHNRIFQKMTIALQVGAPAGVGTICETLTSGITVESAVAQPPAPPNLVDLAIIKRENGYQFVLSCGGVKRAFVTIHEQQIADMVAQARDILKDIVYTTNNGAAVYLLENTAIPADIHATSLKKLARLGFLFYQQIFTAGAEDVRAMGVLLRKISKQHQLRIRIIAERFTFPWALLYDRADLKPDQSNVDPEGFWGFKHEIEYPPEFTSTTPERFVPRIEIDTLPGLGFVYNTVIDSQLKHPIIQQQRDFLTALFGQVAEYHSRQELYDLLNNADAAMQLLYFYCHAVSNLPGERGGIDGSRIILDDGEITLADLKACTSMTILPFTQAPLILLNACQSAKLSPYIYDGLVPYFVERGARGLIGTEADTPAFFAAEFGQELLRRFIAGGQPIGALLLNLRREYLFQNHNVLGLLYALHCSGDVAIWSRHRSGR